MKREELLRSKHYWLANVQNDIYGLIQEFKNKEDLNQTQLAKKLKVSKGYISQIINGDFDHKISKLIGLALAFNKVPIIKYEDLDTFIDIDNKKSRESHWSINFQDKVNVDYLPVNYEQICEHINTYIPSQKNTPSISDLYTNGGQVMENTLNENSLKYANEAR